jgi:sugar-specific transcriptional regulator TrmB/DNA-binding CsgD family transcriptional regulator
MGASSLKIIGLSDEEEAVYRFLIDHPGSVAERLRELTGLSRSRVRSAVRSLQARGLLVRRPRPLTGLVPASPEGAIEGLVLQALADLDEVRSTARDLSKRLKAGSKHQPPLEVVEVLLGREAIHRRVEQMYRLAKKRMRFLDRPPYVDPAVDDVNADEVAALRRGVTVQAIYSREAIEFPGQSMLLEQHTAAGEEARVLPEVPSKLLIVDDLMAVMALERDKALVADEAVVIHASSLLDALALLFDSLWSRSTPISQPQHAIGKVGTDERTLLALLMAGLKDDVIARQLGVDVRTVRRRISKLLSDVDAQTRFQAGAQAVRRGLV